MRGKLRNLSIAGLALLATSLHARDNAVLRNGFTLSHDHHRQLGSVTRLFLTPSEDEYVDMPTAAITGYEPDEAIPPAQLNQIPTYDLPPTASKTPTRSGYSKSPSREELKQIVDNAAQLNQIDSDFVQAVILAESNGNANAVSAKGAQGLMQLMPATAGKLGVKNSFDAGENVIAGTKYLRELLALYNNDPIRALAAYNAGTARVQQYHGVPPYRETRAYVGAIIRDFNRRKLEQERATNLANAIPATASRKNPPDGN